MATNTVKVTMQIRQATSAQWLERDPILAEGEFGLELNTYLIKIGNGLSVWSQLPYLNKLNETYFKRMTDGSLTFSDSFAETINNIIVNAGGDAQLVIIDDPTEATDPVNYSFLQRFVADAISNSGHLTREIVQQLPTENISTTTIYMVPNSNNNGYEEYMYIQGVWDKVGDTGDHSGYVLPVAAPGVLGGVKAVNDSTSDYLGVTNDGFMTLNKVSTSKLYVPTGDVLVLYGGSA